MIIINFTPEAYAKINYTIFAESQEVHFDGFVTKSHYKDEDEEYYFYNVRDITLPPQTVGAAHTMQTSTQLSDWLDTLTDEQFNTRRFFGHSHVDFSVSPSGTDVDNQEEYIKAIRNDDFAVFWIQNKKGEFFCRVVDKEFGFDTDKTKESIYYNIEWTNDFWKEFDNIEKIKYQPVTTYPVKDFQYDGFTDFTGIWDFDF